MPRQGHGTMKHENKLVSAESIFELSSHVPPGIVCLHKADLDTTKHENRARQTLNSIFELNRHAPDGL